MDTEGNATGVEALLQSLNGEFKENMLRHLYASTYTQQQGQILLLSFIKPDEFLRNLLNTYRKHA
jgi:hypothetical protein